MTDDRVIKLAWKKSVDGEEEIRCNQTGRAVTQTSGSYKAELQ
jgi:hypothetical protein